MKKILLSILGAILFILISYGITFYFSFFQGDTYVKDGIVQGKSIDKNALDNYKQLSTSYETAINPPVEIKDINFNILGKALPKDSLKLLYNQRYYLSIKDICNIFNYAYSNSKITFDSTIINLKDSTWLINEKKYLPRGGILKYKNKEYISIADIEYIFNSTAIFDSERKSVSLLNSTLNKRDAEIKKLEDGKVALLRFEDVTAGGSFGTTLDQTKFKAMGDYLYENNTRFNIAWVPRYIHPENNIDNDLLKANNIENAGFINMLDYLINCGGEIGLHGYTHQSKDTISTVGSELTKNDNSSETETRKIIESGIYTAQILNIPVHFYESPHYHATATQKEIIGEYFQYQYEPYNLLYYIALKETKNNNLFIPTPLSYVKDRDPSSVIEKLKSPPPNFLASMFYHPTLELDYISFESKNNTFTKSFSSDSILQKLVTAFKENGYTTIHASDFGN